MIRTRASIADEVAALERRVLLILAAAGCVLGCNQDSGDDDATQGDPSSTTTHATTTAAPATTTDAPASTSSSDASTTTTGTTGAGTTTADTTTTSDATTSDATTSAGSTTDPSGCNCAEGELCVVHCDFMGYPYSTECVVTDCTACTPECEAMLCGDPDYSDCESAYCRPGGDINCGDFGRPYLVDGAARTAPLTERGDWLAPLPGAAGTAHDAAEALAEHASIAAFAQLVLDLLALAAPPALIHDAARALADEVEHARLAFARASAHHGAAVGPGPLTATRRSPASLATLVIDSAIAAAMETCGSFAMRARGHAEADPALAANHHRVADDELRHAELGWRILAWGLTQDPSLRSAADDALARTIPAASATDVDPAGRRALTRLLTRTRAAIAPSAA